jgi:hypothetical protein
VRRKLLKLSKLLKEPKESIAVYIEREEKALG